MLIDTMISLPQDSLLAARPLGSSQIAPADAHGAMPGSSQCALFVLVSSAHGLPMLPAAASTQAAPQSTAIDGAAQTRAPSAFVAVKAARDIVSGGSVQGTTRVVGQQCNPVWSAPTCCAPSAPLPHSPERSACIVYGCAVFLFSFLFSANVTCNWLLDAMPMSCIHHTIGACAIMWCRTSEPAPLLALELSSCQDCHQVTVQARSQVLIHACSAGKRCSWCATWNMN